MDRGLAIETTGLSRRWGGVVAVEGLDLKVQRGELFGLVGPDGAGKTTTLRLLAGLLGPTSGTRRVLGLDPVSQGNRIKEKIGYLSQRFSLYPDLTVGENLSFLAQMYGVPATAARERARELLVFSGLAPFKEWLGEHLSGGMKQKLALACALIHRPELLLLDEPTTGVDPISRRELWKLLREVLEQGTTILLTTPYMDEAERCHTVGFLHQGRLLASASPQALKGLMKGELLEVRSPKLGRAGLQAAIQGFPHIDMYSVGSSLHLVVVEAGAARPQLETYITQRGLSQTQVCSVPPSLDDVFVSLIRGVS